MVHDTRDARAAVLCGIGGWVPPAVVSNDMLAEELDTSDDWIRTRTGVEQRHIADKATSTGDLAVEAARRALTSADRQDVDAVLLATTTPDRPCPATAPMVAAELGLTGKPSFDVAAVCSGFVYALSVGADMIVAGSADSVLVIGADTFSKILDPEDRSTRAIFGDGGGAAVLRAGTPDDPGALLSFDLGTDGTGMKTITVPGGGSEKPLYGDEADEKDAYFAMDGKAVFSRAAREMSDSVSTIMSALGWTHEDVDILIAHQANKRILTSCADRLGLDQDKVFMNLDKVGNTSAASIPLALADAAAKGALIPGHRMVLSAFGGGLTWGSTALRWPDLAAD